MSTGPMIPRFFQTQKDTQKQNYLAQALMQEGRWISKKKIFNDIYKEMLQIN